VKQSNRINDRGASGPVGFDAASDIIGHARLNRFANGAWQATLLK
jgi:hypothetical protein